MKKKLSRIRRNDKNSDQVSQQKKIKEDKRKSNFEKFIRRNETGDQNRNQKICIMFPPWMKKS